MTKLVQQGNFPRVFVGDSTIFVRKMKITAKTPSLGKGAAACEVAGRGFACFASSLNPSLPLPREGIARAWAFKKVFRTLIVLAPTRAKKYKI